MEWFRVPLRAPDRRARAVAALVDRTYPDRDGHAARRRELRELLGATTETAAGRDGIELYLSTQAVLGVPVPASLLVTAGPAEAEQRPRVPVPMAADGLRELLRERWGGAADVSVADLPSGPAVRCRRQGVTDDAVALGQPPDRPLTLLDFHLPVPGTAAWLLLTFSTPLPELADAQVEMFDAVAASLRWTGAA